MKRVSYLKLVPVESCGGLLPNPALSLDEAWARYLHASTEVFIWAWAPWLPPRSSPTAVPT